MNIVAQIILDNLSELPLKGGLILPIPIINYACLNCGRKTSNILNYDVQHHRLGNIVFRCIKKNLKNAPNYRHPISVCGTICLTDEIASVADCILESITE